METKTDPRLALLSRPFSWKGGRYLSVSALSAFSFGGGEEGYVSEAELWATAAPVLEQGLTLEEGFPKPGKEFFVAGSAYAPGGGKAEMVKIGAAAGGMSRELRVAGDRTWNGSGLLPDPEPFAAMPVDWTRAAGGPGNPGNPLGKTEAPETSSVPPPVPNVFEPGGFPAAPGKSVKPATMLPLGMWGARAETPAVNDGAWPADGEPGEFPKNFNWDWFHAADPAQRGRGAFEPGEPFSVSGMHPEKTTVSGTVPREFPWVRIERADGKGGLSAAEVKLKPDTLWLFPDQEKGILVWHGTVPVAEADASDVVFLRGGFGERPALDVAPPPAVAALSAAPPPPPPPPPPLPPLSSSAAAGVSVSPPAETTAMPSSLSAEAPEPPPDEPEDVAVESAAPPRTEAERAREVRRDIRELLDAVGSSSAMYELGDELVIFNGILADHGLEPITEAQYREFLPGFIGEMEGALVEIPDEKLAKLNPPMDEYAFWTEEDIVNHLAEKMAAGGVPPAKARELAATIFEPLDASEQDTVMEMLTKIANADWTDFPLSSDELEDATLGIDMEARKARLDEICLQHFGKDFDTLTSLDDDTVPLPASREELARIVNDPEAMEQVEPLLAALFDEMPDEAREEALARFAKPYAKARELLRKNPDLFKADVTEPPKPPEPVQAAEPKLEFKPEPEPEPPPPPVPPVPERRDIPAPPEQGVLDDDIFGDAMR